MCEGIFCHHHAPLQLMLWHSFFIMCYVSFPREADECLCLQLTLVVVAFYAKVIVSGHPFLCSFVID